jgi:dolichol-phosphate mannosyltransferase
VKLTIIVPAYNEGKTIKEALNRLTSLKVPFKKEIIVVDDGSTDNTQKIVKDFRNCRYIRHLANKGKGQAISTGIKAAIGDYLFIQDADLEYHPKYLEPMLTALSPTHEIIYGSRLTNFPTLWGKNRTPFLIHFAGNRFLSLIASILYKCWLTDIETCYKLFPKNAVNQVKSKGFEVEVELTAKFLKGGYKIKEVPIVVKPRTYAQGKKIRAFRDGFKALVTLLKYKIYD